MGGTASWLASGLHTHLCMHTHPTCPPAPAPHPADERACAYIAGAAPNRWGNFTAAQQQGRRAAPGFVQPPLKLDYGATPDQLAEAAEIRRGHPLYASISLGESAGAGAGAGAGGGGLRREGRRAHSGGSLWEVSAAVGCFRCAPTPIFHPTPPDVPAIACHLAPAACPQHSRTLPPALHPHLRPAGLLTEIVNSRLFTTVRDTLGLTYDVSFELSLFDRLPSGARWSALWGSAGKRSAAVGMAVVPCSAGNQALALLVPCCLCSPPTHPHPAPAPAPLLQAGGTST